MWARCAEKMIELEAGKYLCFWREKGMWKDKQVYYFSEGGTGTVPNLEERGGRGDMICGLQEAGGLPCGKRTGVIFSCSERG